MGLVTRLPFLSMSFGLIIYGIQQIPGIPPIVKTVVFVIVGVVLLLWALNYVGGMGHGVSFNTR